MGEGGLRSDEDITSSLLRRWRESRRLDEHYERVSNLEESLAFHGCVEESWNRKK